jgi:hypothetical protein
MSYAHPERLNAPELFLVKSAARLLTAVRWLEEHPPPTEKWGELDSKVTEEIVSTLKVDLSHTTDSVLRCLLAPSSQLSHKARMHLVCILSSR